jgi:hypothetical protein
MLSAFAMCCAGDAVSVAVTVKLKVPTVVGVPVIAPVLGFNVRPVGSAPLVTAQVTGAVPPVEASVAEYGEDTTPFPSEVVEIAKVLATCSVRDFVSVWNGEDRSFTFTVNVLLPGAVGVPEITPVLASSVSPAGNAPEVTDQV